MTLRGHHLARKDKDTISSPLHSPLGVHDLPCGVSRRIGALCLAEFNPIEVGIGAHPNLVSPARLGWSKDPISLVLTMAYHYDWMA